MRTLLIITKQPSMAAAIESVLAPELFQIITKEEVADAEFLLSRGAIDVVILDLELSDSRALRSIEDVKGFASGCPILVYAGAGKQWEWEEDAYLHGVQQVLMKPVRGRMLNTILQRLFPAVADVRSAKTAVEPAPDPARSRSPHEPVRALEALRRFSGVLAHSLDPSALLKQFLLLLREVIGVNRAIIFLRKPGGLLSDSPLSADDRWLRSACAIGLDQSVLQHFALSLGAGIGGYLHRQGRILRIGNPDAQNSREITKEFQLLGAQVAIPILDRQSLIGVAVLDERLTGEAYANEELAIIFHMLEEVGLAIRNSWLYGQLQANHAMVADILGHLGSGCLVVGENLVILHSNAAAARILVEAGSGRPSLEFADIPQHIGSLIFTVIKSGVAVPPFKHQFKHSPELWHRIAIVPFAHQNAAQASTALLMIDDITDHERAQRLDVEASNLRLVKAMAEHLAHEIGNALVPMSTHQQLMKDSINDPEFQDSLSATVANGVKRIARLSNQMNFLAREWTGVFAESVQVSDLIVEAFHEAHTYHPGKKVAQLSFNNTLAPWKVAGDIKALRHAFSEIILNALQANPDSPTVAVRLQEKREGEPELQVEVCDTGAGFSTEAALRAAEPYFSTRNVGLGIGLTVSRKIIESHHGRLEFPAPIEGKSGIVRILLPILN